MARWAIPPDLHHATGGGPLCYMHEHNLGSRDGRIPRYSDSHACVRCIAALLEGRLALDVHRIEPRHRRRFLEFWSFVEIGEPDSCWPWRGRQHTRCRSGYFSIPRHWGQGRSYSAPRVATWFSWGDVGVLPIKAHCTTPNCCNPLHLRVQGVPHFYYNRKLQVLDLEYNSRKLLQETEAFLQVTAHKDPKRFAAFERQNQAWIQFRLERGGPLDFGAVHDQLQETGLDLEADDPLDRWDNDESP